MLESPHPKRRMLVAVDMESYSRRDNLLQYEAQQRFQQVMEAASHQLGLGRVDWLTQQGGDGELAILPPGVNETTVVTRLAPTLDRLLRSDNRGREERARVRLRVALHEGLVHLDGANGYPGEAVVTVCRLVDAAPLKAALRRFPQANVALIVSDRLYQDVVRHYQELRSERFLKVAVTHPEKGFDAEAWIFVPEEDVTAAANLDGDSRPADGTVPTSIPASQYFGSVTTNGPAAFGNHNIVGRGNG